MGTSLILPRKARKQPQKATPLNQKHWLARSATFAISGVKPFYNAALDTRMVGLTFGGTGSVQRGTKAGYALHTPNGSWADFNIGQNWVGPNTVIAICRVNSMDSPWGGLFSKSVSSTLTVTNCQFTVGRDGSNDRLYGFVGNTFVSTLHGSTISGLSDFNVLVFTHSGVTNTGFACYKNGVLFGGSTGTQAQESGVGAISLGRSNNYDGATDSDVDWIAFVRLNQVLDTREITEISRDFWELWEPDSNRTIFIPAAGDSNPVGTGDITEEDDTVSAVGTTTAVGTGAFTEDSDIVAATGTTTVKGLGAFTEENDIVLASGAPGNSVSGTGSITEENDTVSGTGTTTVLGNGSFNEADDIVSSAGTTTILGACSFTEENDIVSASGV